ncbi:MAG: homocysteine S-methyltransferase family protein, partial [Megasphaera sp.]|nr:homocysteine S-methyltransferase family protein [Megasphaera sp.]
MTNEAFQRLLDRGVVVLDGATGTNLQQAGMPIGVCPEQWILENRQVMIDLQRKFIEAGTDIVYAPTFTGNRLKLAEYGLDQDLKAINEGLV